MLITAEEETGEEGRRLVKGIKGKWGRGGGNGPSQERGM